MMTPISIECTPNSGCGGYSSHNYSEQSTTELTYDPDSGRRDSDLWTDEFYFFDVLRPCDLERQSFLFHLGRHDIDDSSVSDEAERFRK